MFWFMGLAHKHPLCHSERSEELSLERSEKSSTTDRSPLCLSFVYEPWRRFFAMLRMTNLFENLMISTSPTTDRSHFLLVNQ
jgi:hypothetical protein